MATLAEQVITFRAAGLPTVQGAISRVGASLQGIGSTATGVFSRFGSAIKSVFNPMNVLQGMGIGVGMSLAQGMGSAIKSAVAYSAQIESLTTSFRVLLGSSQAANQMMEEITKFAAETPFEQMDLSNAARQLLAYGTNAKDIIPTMRQLGDIAALSGANLGELTGIYGKIASQGRLTAETLEGFQSRGIPITRELANVFGVAESEVRNLVSTGAIGFPQVQDALARLTEEGGQFHNGMQQLSQTTAGLWSVMTDSIKTALGKLGTQIIETFDIRGMLASLSGWFENLGNTIGATLEQWGPYMVEVINTIGSALNMVWDMAQSVIGAVGEVVSSFLNLGDIDIGKTLSGFLADLQFFFDNWRLMLAYTWEYWKLVLANMWERIKAFFNNAVSVVVWFVTNWKDIFLTTANFIGTVFTNLGKNLRAIWKAVLDFIAGRGFHVDWTPMTEGFKSTISEMPEMTEAAVRQTTPELERLTNEMAERRREQDERKAKAQAEREAARAKAAAKAGEEAAPRKVRPPTAKPPTKPVEAPKVEMPKPGAAGPGISFVGLAALATQMQEEAGKRLQEQIAAETKRNADAAAKLANAAAGNAVRVQVVNGLPAGGVAHFGP